MSALDDVKARTAALAPADLAAFRLWFLDLWFDEFVGPSRGREAQDAGRRAPADYEAFDPVAFDAETEALDAYLDDRPIDDLRNLRSEAEAEAVENADEPDPESYWEFKKRYAPEEPEPARDDAEARAAWEWDRLDAYYAETGRLALGLRHRMWRGAFVAKEAAMYRKTERLVSPLADTFQKAARRPRRKPVPPEPWPSDDPEGDIRKYQVGMDPDRRAWRGRERERSPSFGPVDDFHAGVLGWECSLTSEDYTRAAALRDALDAAHEAEHAVTSSRRPARIGRTMLRLRRALGGLHDAEAALGAAAREPWLTPAAHRRLAGLLVAARDATLDHYVDVRAEYAALREVAERVLGSATGTA